jgi:hypothetical protein
MVAFVIFLDEYYLGRGKTECLEIIVAIKVA